MKRHRIVLAALFGAAVFFAALPAFGQSYWTGNGGADMGIIAMLVPDGKGLAAGENYLPALAQSVLVGDFTKFSAVRVLDRQNLEKVIAEGESGYYADESNFVQLGAVTNMQYVLNGTLQKTGGGFSLQLKITDAKSGLSRAAYTGACSAAEFENLSGVKKASADLLAQLGVKLTDAGKTALLGVDPSRAQAEAALARGITAQRGGAEVAALISYYLAAAFDPSLLEAVSRATVLSANISSGSIGADARNDIQWRKDWIARLTEAERYFENFYKTSSPPAAIYYSTGLAWGKVNYQSETLPCSFEVNLRSYANWFEAVERALQDVYTGLDKTGRKGEWGLASWPQSTITGYGAFSGGKRYTIVFELVNDRKEVIGRQSVNLDVNWRVYINEGVRVSYNQDDFDTLYYNVKADVITDRTAVRIASVNGQDPQAAAKANSLSLIALNAGEWASNVQWEKRFSNGTITKVNDKLSGSLYIPNAIWGEPVTAIGDEAFSGYENLGSVTIGNSVTNIGERAFSGCGSLTSVTIPNSVTFIGPGAFYKCSNLTSVAIGNSVTSIGGGVFQNCSSLTSVTIPNSVTNIGDEAFSGCGLTSVTIPNSVTSIGAWAFSNCERLTSVTIPNSVTSIGEVVFTGCRSLTSVIIPNSVTSIGYRAFADSGLTSVAIPNSVTFIGGGAFYYCGSLTSVTIPNSVTSIGPEAFSGCKSLTSVTIPNSVTNIGDGAFSGCGLTSVTIGNRVTSIGNRAFYGSALTSVTIPNSVTSIGNSAFSGSGLTSVTIPNSVTSIGNSAFAGSGLTSVTFAEGSKIAKERFDSNAFPEGNTNGDKLKKAYLSGGAGTYTRSSAQDSNWKKR